MGESSNQGDLSTNITWTNRLEDYFASTGEKAIGLAWVHKRAEAIYSTRKTYIDLPVIIGSGVIAFLNAGSSSLFSDPKISSVALGIGSLTMGILNSVGTYFGWAKRSEGHRISAIHYSKLYRFITVELSLPRTERMIPHDFLKYVKDQYDRLAEISPMVPEIVIHEFQRRFKNDKDISKPEEANGLHKIDVYREYEDDLKELKSLKSPSPTVKRVTSFEELMSPKKLPTLTVRIPETRKNSETKKPEVLVPKESEDKKKHISASDVVVEVPLPGARHDD